ncbi:hypothetical protein SESBI_16310 [Sesbania bispinosa]|nr:hypothetical protein SESBI_16310 [Sesbania bispinosa]
MSALKNALEKDLSTQEEDLVLQSVQPDSPNPEIPASYSSADHVAQDQPLNSQGHDPEKEPSKASANPFGPWMIVKKPQRRKSDYQGNGNKNSIPNRSSQEDQDPPHGSRFSLLQFEDTEVINEVIEDETPLHIQSPQPTLQIKEHKIRNPVAGKNPQNGPSKKLNVKKPIQPLSKKTNVVSGPIDSSGKILPAIFPYPRNLILIALRLMGALAT